MNAYILKELQEAGNKFGAYWALLDFRYKNLCVKADATCLLPVTVMANGYECNLEDVASVGQPNDYQLSVIPNEEMYLQEITKGIFEAHPEFKVKLMARDDNNAWELDPSKDNSEEKGEKFLIYTMPEVDKNQRDALNEGVKALHKECKTKVDIVNFNAKQKMQEGSFVCTQKDMDEGYAQLQERYETTKEKVDQLLQEKLEEIEEGYQRYLEGQAAEQQASTDNKVSTSMKMGSD